jgi:hypothetical protein
VGRTDSIQKNHVLSFYCYFRHLARDTVHFDIKGTFVPGQSGGLRDKSISFSVRTLPKLLNGAFFTKNFYRKVALKNHINPFLKFKIVNTQLIMC